MIRLKENNDYRKGKRKSEYVLSAAGSRLYKCNVITDQPRIIRFQRLLSKGLTRVVVVFVRPPFLTCPGNGGVKPIKVHAVDVMF